MACTPMPAEVAWGTCPLPVTPAGTYPAALTPKPPTSDFGAPGPIGIMQGRQIRTMFHKPTMASAEINVRDRIVAPLSHLVGLVFYGAPEIRDEPVAVTYDLKSRWIRRREQHRRRPTERLNILFRAAKALPYVARHGALAAEIGKRRN